MTQGTRQIYVISDLHLGGVYAENQDDSDRGFRICTRVDRLCAFVAELTAKDSRQENIELVINGDVVDFLAERNESSPHWGPFEPDPDVAKAKLNAIVDRDRGFFDGLTRFLDAGHRLVLLLGNHDLELSLPAVRREFERLLNIQGHHDYQFIYDGEAYTVGDVLIEHGNRYDGFNVINNDALRRLRSLQSRSQEVDREYEFPPPPGSRMVSDVMNPIKEDYRFIDLLKPETGAAVPVLLALEPSLRRQVLTVTRLVYQASKHAPETPAMPSMGSDIHAGGDIGGIGEDIGSFESPAGGKSAAGGDDVSRLLADVLGDDASEFERALGYESTSDDGIGSDIASLTEIGETLSRIGGFARLLTARDDGNVRKRLPALLKAMRALQNDDSFRTDAESMTDYLDAAEQLSKGGFRAVVFGHTHMPRAVRLDSGAMYFNSGTWADVLRFPKEVVSGDEDQALEKLAEFTAMMKTGDFSPWTLFRPTYVRIELDETDTIVDSALHEYE